MSRSGASVGQVLNTEMGSAARSRGLAIRESMEYARITVDFRQMGGVPCIRCLRIPVATVVDMVAEGISVSEVLDAYPDLEPEDVREALRYAAEAVRERELPLLSA